MLYVLAKKINIHINHTYTRLLYFTMLTTDKAWWGRRDCRLQWDVLYDRKKTSKTANG